LPVIIASKNTFHPDPESRHDFSGINPLEISEIMGIEFFFELLFIDHEMSPPRVESQ
jgi:hypothetical protein